MAVYIGYNYAGKIISIVNAKNKELANAYWQGANIIPHSISCLDDEERWTPLEEHPTGVYPILQTIEIVAGRMDKEAKVLCIK